MIELVKLKICDIYQDPKPSKSTSSVGKIHPHTTTPLFDRPGTVVCSSTKAMVTGVVCSAKLALGELEMKLLNKDPYNGLLQSHMDVSENRVFSPQIIHFNRVFHYQPSILRYPYFWKHPYNWVGFHPQYNHRGFLIAQMVLKSCQSAVSVFSSLQHNRRLLKQPTPCRKNIYKPK